MHGCDPGRVSDGSRLALYQTLSIECSSSIFFLAGIYWYRSFLFVVSVSFRYVFFCSRWSFVDVPLIFFCPADQVPDWQPRILLGMVEARSVNVKKTTTTRTTTKETNQAANMKQRSRKRNNKLYNAMKRFCLCSL